MADEEPRRRGVGYSTNDLIKALLEIRAGEKIRSISRKYKIPRTTLHDKLKSNEYSLKKVGPAPVLKSEEETSLKDWILIMAKKGFPVDIHMVSDTVKCIIESDNRRNRFKDNTPGMKWFSSFLRRNPDVIPCYEEFVSTSRNKITESTLLGWYTSLRDYLDFEDASDILNDPERIIAADELDFSATSAGLVMGLRGLKLSKKTITALTALSASGNVLPSLLVYSLKDDLKDIAEKANTEWCIETSSKGAMTTKALYNYMSNTLIPYLQNREVKFPVLFLIDGKKIRINRKLSELCAENGIILYSLLPKGNQWLHPVEIAVVILLRDDWKQIVKKWMLQTKHESVTIDLLAPLLESVLQKVSPDIIRSVFKQCGLYPFDVDVVIDYAKNNAFI